MKTAIVTITVGDRYEQMAAITHPSIKAYADKIKADFIDWRRFQPHIHPDFQKLEIKSLFEVEGYDRIAFIDTDVIIRADSPNIFDVVPTDRFAGFNEFPFKPRIETMRQYLDGERLRLWAKREEYFNAGIFVCSAEHQEVFHPPAVELSGFYFQSYMNYRLFSLGLKTLPLDRRFNHIDGMNPFSTAPRHGCYFLHYAGNGLATRALLQLIRDDLRLWQCASPEYRFTKPLGLRLACLARRAKAYFRTKGQFNDPIIL